ncbi:DNA -binding domain-containing protein [Brytella acorum]|uniref:DNA -binding domain-containing protein n=1 Tax=Brytella acorum TaxID=2959299 RepID=UPI0025ADCD4A|nr:DUF2285 domain-containing protein [Brytella acorum]MDF3625948.1 DUF2285 domain-containing protein [Brytella acorum]
MLLIHKGVIHRLWLRAPPVDGALYAGVLPADISAVARAWSFLRLCRALSGRSDPGPYRVMPARTEALHRQALAALDAAERGASEWEIGRTQFGYRRPRQEWEDDAIRAVVRRALARGRRDLAGGYRRFLSWQAGSAGRRQRA